MKRFVFAAALLVVLFASGVLGCSSVAGGLVNDRLKDCPSSPNCVCSTDSNQARQIAPLDLGAHAEAGWDKLVQVLANLERTHIASRDSQYVHAVVTSRLLRFRDDLELRFDRDAGVAQVRSASRMGYSDLGVNRQRVEELRTRLAAALAEK
ncbi:MAG: hypothetical protein DHS20C15_34800 [Planctomycetota bacterium]|nr:MAG: hypothetical protein DHS20C15_34800 [Planctomycetota bacterium]